MSESNLHNTMARNRRPKSRTNPTAMPTDTPDDFTEIDDAIETPAEVVTEAVSLPSHDAPAEPTPPAPPSPGVVIPKDVLRAVFNRNTTAAVADTLWEDAVTAVKAGKLVNLRQSFPFVLITDAKFEGGGGTTVLNNLIAGML